MADNFEYETIKFTDGGLKAEIIDKDGDPNRVIENTAESTIKVDWWLATTDPWILGGSTFHLEAVAEQIGSGEVTPLATLDVPVTVPELSWSKEMTITPGLKPPDGAYHIVVLLTHLAPYPNGVMKKTRIVGFAELPIVQFYTHEV